MDIEWILIAPNAADSWGAWLMGRHMSEFSLEITPALGERCAFLIDGPQDWVAQQLSRVRASAEHGWRPAFVGTELDPLLASLADGLIQEASEAKARYILQLRSLLFVDLRMSADERLLHFMALRRGALLRPVASWQQSSYYRYPLLELVADDDTPAELRLQSLIARKLIEEETYIDRQYQCRHCHAAHLKLLDHCPECQSSDIQSRPALHCFTCGHVAPQDNFRRHGMLVCPQCDARLRHIGADYDRPVENHSCNACGAYFIEGKVRATCLVCLRDSELEELINRRICSYRLSEAGRLAAKQGRLQDVYAVLDDINYVSRDFFMHSLQWQIGMSRRHSEIRFGLVGLQLLQINELIEQQGYYQASRLIDAFAERLRELLRATDLCSRSEQDLFWILLPQCSPKGLLALKQRIEQLFAELISAQQSLDCRLLAFDSSQMLPAEDAELLLARLTGQLE